MIADHRLQNRVGHAVAIAHLNGVDRVFVLNALAIDQRVIGVLHALPPGAAIHCVIPAHNRGDLAHAQLGASLLQLLHKALAGLGPRIPSVEEAVDIHALEALDAGHFQQRVQVLDGRMHRAVGQKTHQMQCRAIFQAVVHRLIAGRILEKRAVGDGPVDAGQRLRHDAPAADVVAARGAVARLTLAQTHVGARGRQRRMGIGGIEPVERRGVRRLDGVALDLLTQPQAVHDD